MLVVADSGIWISAMKFGGTPAAALEKALTQHRVAICTQVIAEVEQVLTVKFAWQLQVIQDRFKAYLPNAIWIAVPGTLTGVCRDPKDDFIFECAVLANADVIISGDKDLLAVETFRGIRVLSSRQYISLER